MQAVIFSRTEQQFIDRFHKEKLFDKSEMPWNCYKRMNDDALKAIFKFLKTVPATKTSDVTSK
jgi:hypothetical protein